MSAQKGNLSRYEKTKIFTDFPPIITLTLAEKMRRFLADLALIIKMGKNARTSIEKKIDAGMRFPRVRKRQAMRNRLLRIIKSHRGRRCRRKKHSKGEDLEIMNTTKNSEPRLKSCETATICRTPRNGGTLSSQPEPDSLYQGDILKALRNCRGGSFNFCLSRAG